MSIHRTHNLLVYFGLKSDPDRADGFADSPVTGPRLFAVVVFVGAVVAVITGLLLAAGVSSFGRALVSAVVAVIAVRVVLRVARYIASR